MCKHFITFTSPWTQIAFKHFMRTRKKRTNDKTVTFFLSDRQKSCAFFRFVIKRKERAKFYMCVVFRHIVGPFSIGYQYQNIRYSRTNIRWESLKLKYRSYKIAYLFVLFLWFLFNTSSGSCLGSKIYSNVNENHDTTGDIKRS